MNKEFVILLLSLLLVACNKETPPPASVERPVLTMVVGAHAAADGSSVYSGEVRARYETVLGFRIGGKIIERLVDAGALVKKGQVLARLDAADTGLQENEAAARYQLSEEDLKRYRELRAQGFVSQSALDTKEVELKAASAQAGLARNQAAYTTLVSDRDGVVSATLAEVGQVVSAGQGVVRVAQEGAREVLIAIPESRFVSTKVGELAEIELGAMDGGAPTILRGHVREISPAADSASHTYPVRVAFDMGNAKVAQGMTARVRLNQTLKEDRQKGNGFLLPLTAIFQQGDKAAVWIVAADHSVSLRPVVVSAYRDDGALISSGIVVGERIVIAGVHKLTAGEKIKPAEEGKEP
jgi:RND family efflux transporter MFP subunit